MKRKVRVQGVHHITLVGSTKLDEIWEYIAKDNVDAADRVLADIHLIRGTGGRA